MQKKIDSYEAKLIEQEYLESDRKENEILILRAENSILKKFITEKEIEINYLKNEISKFRKESRKLLSNKKLIIQKLKYQNDKNEKNFTITNTSNIITNTNINTNLNTYNNNTINTTTTNNHNFNSNYDISQASTHRIQYLNHDNNKTIKDKNTFNKSQKMNTNVYSSNSSRINIASIENTVGNNQITNENFRTKDFKRFDKNLSLKKKLNSDFISIPLNDEILNSAFSSKNFFLNTNEEKELIVTNYFKQTGLLKKNKDNKHNLYRNIFKKLIGLTTKNYEVQ